MPQFVIGPGFKQKIEELKWNPLGSETYISPDYSVMLCAEGTLWYSKPANTVVADPFVKAAEA